MHITRRILAVVLIVALCFSVVNAGALGAETGVTEPTEAQIRSDVEQYKKETGSTASSQPKVEADATLVDGIAVPPDVAALKSFKAGDVKVIISVAGRPVLGEGAVPATPEMAKPLIATRLAAQESVLDRLAAAGVAVRNVDHYYFLINAFSGTVHTNELARLVKVVGAENFHFARMYEADLASSVPLIGAGSGATGNGVGLDGTGMTVGVVDTGVDWKHPDFYGSPASTFGTTKVVAGYDFGDGDGDPMDSNGHGTHVSGIIGADGTVKGVAPKANLVVAKIVAGGEGSADSATIINAFEYMADPLNLDAGPEGTHPAVASINMSFGSIAGFVDPSDPEMQSIEACVSAGIVVSLSAGNSAQSYTGTGYNPFYPDYSTVGSPSVTPGPISVASSENAWIPGVGVTETAAAVDYVYLLGSSSPDPVASLGDNAGAGYQYVHCGIGQPSDFVGKDLTGRIALIDRGIMSFYIKINNAAAAGAVGVIIANNALGMISMNTDGATLTSVSVSQADGMMLKAKAALTGDGTGRLKFLGHFASTANAAVDTISTFSSWGAPPDLSFKPDVTAPGGNIWSTYPTAMGSYANLSGTSMAAPHVAAAAALVKEKFGSPAWLTPQHVKALLSNSSKVLAAPVNGIPYSPRLQGAGRINVSDAVNARALVVKNTGVEPSDFDASVALGSVENWKTVPITFTLQLRDLVGEDTTYAATGNAQWTAYTIDPYLIPGAVVTVNPSTVTVPAGGHADVTVTIDCTAVTLPTTSTYWSYRFAPYVEGFVSFTPTTGTVNLHVPYMGYLGNYNDFDADAWEPTLNPIIDLPGGSGWSFSRYYTGGYADTGLTWPQDPTAGWPLMGETWTGTHDLNTVAINPIRGTPQGGVEADIWMLRNAQNVKILVRDSTNALVKTIDDVDYVWKGNLAKYGSQYTLYWNDKNGGPDWQWFGEDALGGLVADGQYYMDIEATAQKVVNKATFDAPQVVRFPVFVDTVNPVTTIDTITTTPGGRLVTWTTSDAAPSSGIWGHAVYWTLNNSNWSHAIVAPGATSYTVPAGALSVYVYSIDNAANISSHPILATQHRITYSWTGSGTVTPVMTALGLAPVPSIMVDHNHDQSFAIQPSTGWYIADVVVDGVSKGPMSSYTFHNVVADHDIRVRFEEITYTVKVIVEGSGTVTPSGDITVLYGRDLALSFFPVAGYSVADVIIDGTTHIAGTTFGYTLTNVLADHVVRVKFADLSAPTLNLSGMGTGINQSGTSPVLIPFEAYDGTGAVLMSVRDNGKLILNRQPAVSPLRLDLADGMHALDVMAEDGSGNITTRSFQLMVDTHGPAVEVALPPAPVKASEFVLNGFVSDAISGLRSLTINDTEVAPYADGTFSFTAALQKGVNDFSIVAVDNMGNKTVLDVTVERASGTASPAFKTVTLAIGKASMDVNGMPVAMDAAPVIKNGRTLLPIRALIETLGGKVTWNAKSRTATVALGGRSVVLVVGKNTALVDGKSVAIDAGNSKVVPEIIGSRTFLPLRFIAENLGLDLAWEPISQTISFTYWP